MTLGNIHSSVRNAPSNNAWILVALLPCAPQCTSNNAAELREYQSVKNANLQGIVSELTATYSEASKTGFEIRCSDGYTRLGFPLPCAWLADYLEYTKLYNLESKGCPVCEIGAHQRAGVVEDQ